MRRLYILLLALILQNGILAYPSYVSEQPNFDQSDDENPERDEGGSAKKIIGSSVVTSVSVILNGDEPEFTDAVGKKVPKPGTLQVASPINLLNPDRYEFYTFDDNGELVKRLMTMSEIQSIVANGDGEGPAVIHNVPVENQSNPEKNVQDIVNSVQNVLTKEVEGQKNSNDTTPVLDTPDVSSSWSMILPAIFGNTGGDIFPQNKPQQVVMTPDSDVFESSTTSQKRKPPSRPKPNRKRPTTSTSTTTEATSIVTGNETIEDSMEETTIPIKITTSTTMNTTETLVPSTQKDEITEEIITNVPNAGKKPIKKWPTSTTAKTTTEETETTTVNSHKVFMNNQEIMVPDVTETTQFDIVETTTKKIFGSKRKPNPQIQKNKKKTTTTTTTQASLTTSQNDQTNDKPIQNHPIRKKPQGPKRTTTTSAPDTTNNDFIEQQEYKKKPLRKATTAVPETTSATTTTEKTKPQYHKNKKPLHNKRTTTTIAPETTENDFISTDFDVVVQNNKKKTQINKKTTIAANAHQKHKFQNKKRTTTTTTAPETTTLRYYESEEFTTQQLPDEIQTTTFEPETLNPNDSEQLTQQTTMTTEPASHKINTSSAPITSATTTIAVPIITTNSMIKEELSNEPTTNEPSNTQVNLASPTEPKPSVSPPTVGVSNLLNTEDVNTKLSFDQIMQSLKDELNENSSASDESNQSQSAMSVPPQMYSSAESIEKLSQMAQDKLTAVTLIDPVMRTTTAEPESTTIIQQTKDDSHAIKPETLFADIQEPILTDLTTENDELTTFEPSSEQTTKSQINDDITESFIRDTTEIATAMPVTDQFIDSSSTSFESNESGSEDSAMHQGTTLFDEESSTSLEPMLIEKDQGTSADMTNPITSAVESLLGGIMNNSFVLNDVPTEANSQNINPLPSDKNMTMSLYQQQAATYASKLEEPTTTIAPHMMSENMKNELEFLMSDVINQMTDRLPSTTEDNSMFDTAAIDLASSNQQLSSMAQISSSLLLPSQKVVPEMIGNSDEHAELQTSESQFVHKQKHREDDENDSTIVSKENLDTTTEINSSDEFSAEILNLTTNRPLEHLPLTETYTKDHQTEISHTTTEKYIEIQTENIEKATNSKWSENPTKEPTVLDSTTNHFTEDVNEMSESVEQSGEINIGSSSMEDLLETTTVQPETVESTERPGEFTVISMESEMIDKSESSKIEEQATTIIPIVTEPKEELEPEDSYIKLGERKTTERPMKEEEPTTPIPTTTTSTTISTTTIKKNANTLKPVSYFKQPSSPTEQKLVAFNSNMNQQRPMVRPAQLNNLKVNQNMATRPPVKLDPTPNQSLGLEASTVGLDEDILKFSHLCNELAFSYWRAITSEKISSARSLVISPFALTSMLSMVFLGARGGTSGEMNEILKLDDMVTFNPHLVFKNITDTVEKAQDSDISSSAFVREIFSDRANGKVLNFFKEKTQQLYSGHVEEVNFNVVNDIIRRRTNLLVKRHTMGKVLEYLRTNSVWVNGPLATISANLFQTDCSRASTTDRDGEMFFQVHPSIRQRRLVPIPAAVWKSGFTAGYDPEIDATIVAFGKMHETVSTLYIMPGQQGSSAPGDNLDRLEKNLMETAISKNSWSHMLKLLMERPGLEVQLPRFSHRSFVNASLGLQKMGLKGLFNSDYADLRGLTGSSTKDIYLSDMIQINTFSTCAEQKIAEHHHVEMYPAPPIRKRNKHVDANDDENDSSEMMIDFGSIVQDSTGRGFYDDLLDPKYLELPLPLRPRQARIPDAPRLRFDKPFLYFVRHNPTGMLLFMGRFNPRLLP